jgi:GDPmannose 4,6-dehydratase
VQEFLETAFSAVDLDWREYIKFDPRYLRPTEVGALLGDPSKANNLLGWKANVLMPELCHMMVDSDMVLAQKEQTLVSAGYDMTATPTT